ncbi:MAG: divalent-cation tolerance protein CutA [Candidatus Levybacteria bacterium]|nr:divalent-cation tolerance protein CutA [Candidatus Levybacteria bacterium]
MQMIVLLLTCANEKEADKIANTLLKEKLIVCAKKLPVSSSFLWEKKIKSSEEILLIMDSVAENFEKINSEVKKLHSYKTFVLTSLLVNQTTKDVENWAKKEL